MSIFHLLAKRPHSINLAVCGVFGLGVIGYFCTYQSLQIDSEDLEHCPPVLHEYFLDGRVVLKIYGGRLVGMTAADLEQRFGKGQESVGMDRNGDYLRLITYRLDWRASNPCRSAVFVLKKDKVIEVKQETSGWAVFH